MSRLVGHDREPGRERGLLGRVEDLEDLLPALPGARVRRARASPPGRVEAVDERAVLLLEVAEVTHGRELSDPAGRVRAAICLCLLRGGGGLVLHRTGAEQPLQRDVAGEQEDEPSAHCSPNCSSQMVFA